MGSLEKIVKLACKPKAAPPKSKYLEPIIAATWNEEGAVHDVCKALQPRFREPNAIVVFKALIVLHTMMRNGSTDNVLSYLSQAEVLHLRNVSAGNWEGYHAPQNLQHYAIYLDSRIRAYRDLKHDAIQVQSEQNRDMRLSRNIDEELGRTGRASSGGKHSTAAASTGGLSRGKTLAGRKLRTMTVEKGLLRETKAVQRQIDTLVECRLYLDDLEDPLIITALRMLVQDLLILFSAGNEGVINLLEHYFEMSRVDAQSALAVYRLFCTQCERVVEYLGVAKKLQNLLNVQIPNMKHAPVSLAGALQEYLDDPNFEQNRIEYKVQKEAADKGGRSTAKPSSVSKPAEKPAEKVPTPAPATTLVAPAASSSAAPQNVVDFFESIEQAQSPMFDSPTSNAFGPNIQQNAAFNPFALPQATGAFGASPFGQSPFQAQPTGFVQTQATGFPGMQQPQQAAPNPFGQMLAPQQPQQQQQQQQPPQQQQQPSFGSFLQPQPTAGFLQPQATGANPFRQSMMMPQMTGIPAFGSAVGQMNGTFQVPSQSNSPFAPAGMSASSSASSAFSSASNPSPFTAPPFGAFPSFAAPTPQNGAANVNGSGNMPFTPPARPGSAPITSISAANNPAPALVKTHQTGSRNPFGVPVTPAPPVPKPPTMMELAMGMANGAGQMNGNANGTGSQAQGQAQGQLQPQQTGFGTSLFGGSTGMSSIASSFTFGNNNAGVTPQTTSSTTATTNTATGSFADSLFSQQTSATSLTSGSSAPSFSISPAPLKPQSTGFAGLKAFKPSSNFGATLLENLPPIPGSEPQTPAVTGQPSAAPNSGAGAGLAQGMSSLHLGSNGASSTSPFGTGAFGRIGSQPTGFGALNAQPTGFGQGTGTQAGGIGAGLTPFGGASKTTLGIGLRPQMTGGNISNPFRASMFPNGAPPAQSPSPFGAGGGAGAGQMGSSQSQPNLFGQPTGAGGMGSPFGNGPFGGAPFAGMTGFGQPQQGQGQQSQQPPVSLI